MSKHNKNNELQLVQDKTDWTFEEFFNFKILKNT